MANSTRRLLAMGGGAAVALSAVVGGVSAASGHVSSPITRGYLSGSDGEITLDPRLPAGIPPATCGSAEGSQSGTGTPTTAPQVGGQQRSTSSGGTQGNGTASSAETHHHSGSGGSGTNSGSNGSGGGSGHDGGGGHGADDGGSNHS
jgi:hypothetical protein